ncbi:uncharacterized protein I206_105857 [Kwoniella pini CBS 10737]|uniref:Uncharacterized protein n=1 Tax=Kwoniella pini CBS 10737 TaxID=1296096 RepID=A0A1B9I0D1_9TREE|nr:uncharacterized protein I206_04677 [Kwoniella pini CBS 10737]OCF48990.1 hypothetical protein I206_04677 [Kwoniella pini CBS 10737]
MSSYATTFGLPSHRDFQEIEVEPSEAYDDREDYWDFRSSDSVTKANYTIVPILNAGGEETFLRIEFKDGVSIISDCNLDRLSRKQEETCCLLAATSVNGRK